MHSSMTVFEAAKSHAKKGIRIGIAGDFLPLLNLKEFDQQVWREMAKCMSAYFHDLDIVMVNLEGPVGVDGLRARPNMGLGALVSGDIHALDYLVETKAKVVGIANNHIYDYGPEGLERTRKALHARALIPIGGARNQNDTPEVFVWEGPDGVRVGFWAAANVSTELATRRTAGVEVATLKRAQRALHEMQARRADCSIALLHVGCQGTNYPDPEDVRLLDSMVDAGFDMVTACHSHRISGHKVIFRGPAAKPGFCFYGLGSLCGMAPLYEGTSIDREGLLVVYEIDHEGKSISVELRPMYLDHTGRSIMPATQSGQAILERFNRISHEIEDHSYRQLFYKDMSKDFFSSHFQDLIIACKNHSLRKGLVGKFKRLRWRHILQLMNKVFPARS